MIVKVDNIGVKHIQGCGGMTMETVCGMCDTFTSWTYEDSEPTCTGCIGALAFFHKLATKKEVDQLVKKFKIKVEQPIKNLDSAINNVTVSSLADEFYSRMKY